MGKFIDLTGKKFGMLTVVERAETKYGKTRWKCLCDCGNYTYTITNRLLHGKSLSCGCRAYSGKSVHGMKGTRLYDIWLGMKKRCDNKGSKSYPRYGELGIKVCDDWESNFQNFYDWAISSGYADNLSIDRIDNYKGYSPENCRWVTMDEQARNKRNTIYLEYNGDKQPLSVWCKRYGFPYKSALQRYTHMKKNGNIDFEKIFFKGNLRVKKIEQLTLEGTHVKTWESLSSIVKNGFDHAGVSACCNGKRKSSGGFKWKFV